MSCKQIIKNKLYSTCQNIRVVPNGFAILRPSLGFTIIELLVVVVIIAILAALVIVSYSGITHRAIEASLATDLSNSSTQFKLFYTDNDKYPATIDCSQPDSSTNKCIKPSEGTTLTYTVDNESDPQSYTLIATNSDISYSITDSNSTPVAYEEETITWDSVSARFYDTCGLSSAGDVYCWGRNYYGEVGNNSTETVLSPTAVNTTEGISSLYGKTVTQISVGSQSVCALDSEGKVYCWGYGNIGKLGNNSTSDSHVPVAVNTVEGVSSLYGKTVTEVSVGTYHACALDSEGAVHCWGYNQFGKLGDNSTNNSYVPIAVNTTEGVSSLYGKTVIDISVGNAHTCALDSEGAVHCWGYNSNGILGVNDTVNRLAPVAVNTTNGTSSLYNKIVTAIALGNDHTCALDSEGAVHCWGYGNYGRLGNNSSSNSFVPVAVNVASGASSLYGKTVSQILATDESTCALDSEGAVHCWGRNTYGQLGINSTSNKYVPTAVEITEGLSSLFGKTIDSLSVNAPHHICAVDSVGSLHCWGRNDYGQLGDGTTDITYVPIEIGLP